MIVYMLAKYDKHGQVMGRRLLPGLDPQVLRRAFGLGREDPVSGRYRIDSRNRDLFSLMFGERLDTEAFVWAVEGTRVNDNDL